MNRPSRTDEPYEGEGYNQSPNYLSNDLTTNQDLNGIANTRALRRGEALSIENAGQSDDEDKGLSDADVPKEGPRAAAVMPSMTGRSPDKGASRRIAGSAAPVPTDREGGDEDGDGDGGGDRAPRGSHGRQNARGLLHRIKTVVTTFGKFVGPGFMISVAYSELPLYFTPPSPCPACLVNILTCRRSRKSTPEIMPQTLPLVLTTGSVCFSLFCSATSLPSSSRALLSSSAPSADSIWLRRAVRSCRDGSTSSFTLWLKSPSLPPI